MKWKCTCHTSRQFVQAYRDWLQFTNDKKGQCRTIFAIGCSWMQVGSQDTTMKPPTITRVCLDVLSRSSAVTELGDRRKVKKNIEHSHSIALIVLPFQDCLGG